MKAMSAFDPKRTLAQQPPLTDSGELRAPIFRAKLFVQLPCLVPTRQCGRQWCGRITCDLVEGITVNDPYVPSITELNNAPRDQGLKCPAYGRKRHTDVTANVRMVHRQIDFGCLLALGHLESLDELKEHRELGDGLFLAKQKGVVLRLPEFLRQLANNMKFQLGILGKAATQRSDRKTIRDHVRYRLGPVRILTFCGQTEKVVCK